MMLKWPVLAAVLCCPMLWAQQLSDLSAPTPIPPGSTLVIGFLGGFEHWNDNHRSVRQLTLKLRERPHVYAESFSNWHRTVALEFIRGALDTNQDGNLDPEERAHARVILFGQSLGGAAALATARDLDQLGVPVLLTVQIDSVGLHDQLVPSNVRAAANFYQHDPLTIQGRTHIQAADPSRTRILANSGSSYIFRSINSADVSWARRTLGGSHAKMELDPKIWNHVERLIVDAMPRK